MPLKKMSYHTAERIVDIFSGLLVNLEKLPKYERYSYSSLQGFDIVDVNNALKLIIAYDYFHLADREVEGAKRLQNYVDAAASGLAGHPMYFYPDGIAKQLEQIDVADEKEAFRQWADLTANYEDHAWHKLSMEEETITSFFRFCQHIGREIPGYWNLIYKRIGITWEPKDENDPINLLVNYKK